jgi:serine/threonine protein kinase
LIFEQIALGYVTFQQPEWKTISNEAKIFIKKLLQVNPITRYSARQALDDPWIKIFTGADTIEVTQAIT